MKCMACPGCGAHGVWTRLAKVTRERDGHLVMDWRCGLCGHEWTEGAAP